MYSFPCKGNYKYDSFYSSFERESTFGNGTFISSTLQVENMPLVENNSTLGNEKKMRVFQGSIVSFESLLSPHMQAQFRLLNSVPLQFNIFYNT